MAAETVEKSLVSRPYTVNYKYGSTPGDECRRPTSTATPPPTSSRKRGGAVTDTRTAPPRVLPTPSRRSSSHSSDPESRGSVPGRLASTDRTRHWPRHGRPERSPSGARSARTPARIPRHGVTSPSAVATRDKRRNATGRATCARGRGGRRPRSTPAAPRKPRRSVRGNDVQSVEKILQWSVATNRPPSSPASRASEGRWIHVSSADDTIVTMDHDRHH